MDYTTRCDSPLGGILLAGDGEALVGLWFEGQARFAAGLSETRREGDLPVFDEARRWLDAYFAGRDPGFTPKLSPRGTLFQRAVWARLLQIPYGQTAAYGALAAELNSSARAVGGAVARNPISLIVPCHRVLGAGGAMTGYAGGVARKRRLLALEGALPDGRQPSPASSR